MVLLAGLNLSFLGFLEVRYAKLLHGIVAVLLHVEAVERNHRIGEALGGDGMHTCREVHRYFKHLAALIPEYPVEGFYDILHLRSLDNGYQCPLASMGILVGDDGV